MEEAGREMLESMKATEGVKVLPSGVVVHVLEHGPEGEGEGVRPTKSSTVKIHYHGSLPDGTVFDSTVGGEPVQFPLAGVIPGWRDGKYVCVVRLIRSQPNDLPKVYCRCTKVRLQ